MAPKREPDPVEWVRERWVQQGLPEAERFMAVASVMRAHQVVVSELDRVLRPHGLGRTTYLALVTLALSPDGARPPSYLSRYLMVHQTTVTNLLDHAEKQGWIRREPHPTDRRASLAVLLPAGRQLVREATAAAAAAGFGMGAVDDGTLASLTQSLREVRRAVGDLPEDGT
ncbi:MAG: MarR family transcriptional regulator [Solirubrobacterales bacterium]|jgi:DNA-binding MarR family transcriptional regulator|nr:MarR family transcriptional regulator [Solirubrobacterales bacterium]